LHFFTKRRILEFLRFSSHTGWIAAFRSKEKVPMARQGLMAGKRGLIMGVANDRSIAWGVAQSLAEAGAELAFTYQGETFKKRVVPLVESLKPAAVLDCDVSQQGSIDAVFAGLKAHWPSLDFVVHAIAFSDKEQLKGRYVDTTPENFAATMNISCYSFTAVAQRAEKMMPKGGSMLTLTYYGAEKVMPHYNVMGVAKAALEASVRYMAEDLGKKAIRVNAISAGPIKTLAFAGIADSRYILKWNELNAPLRRTVTTEEVGNSALFLLSDLGKAVTGECLHVDAGYHVVGMKAEDAPDIAVGKNDGA
jgi:enoyl-[acyl-carrier protein] reductase I